MMAFWSSISFQNLLGDTYSFLESLHDFIMVWLLVILILVTFISCKVFFSMKSYLLPDSLTLEQTWTLIPMLILLTIAYPSIHLLCTQDAMCTNPFYTVKVVSNQWNWQSETLDVLDHLLDSEKLDELSSYDYPFLLPLGEVSRIMVSSSDVLHSLGFPSLGVKLDSSPGRLNVTTVEASSLGLMMGSCYELCGSGHSAMPIYALVI